MGKIIRLASIFILLLFFNFGAKASHFYGSDFYYTWVSGNTYKITLVVYGDCNLTPGVAFSTLPSSSPSVDIYNGTTKVTFIALNLQGPGVEVTPVCPSQASNTTCSILGSTIPGVMRFIYSANYTVPSLSANWRFRFEGYMGGSGSQAGRSNSITNISLTPASITALEATLNNTLGHNSNPVYTTIPTPFFCINKPANYNPGAVDGDGDALTFSLVPGLNGSGVQNGPQSTGTVTYIGGATATAPLTTAAGTYSFSTANGQLSFTPNAVQRSLIVSQVSEYRNGVLVGTSMREMTFVVLANCNNNPPNGIISNTPNGINLLNTTTINACKSIGNVTFSINPTDLDGDHITLVTNGLPTGATFTITGNGTTAPLGAFNWNIANVAPGTYNFFITYTDDGCPLSSKQTQAYTLVILANPSLSYALVTPATCIKKAVFTLTPGNDGASPYSITRNGQTFTSITGPVTDSLAPGTYTFTIANSNGCTHDTSITIAPPAVPGILASVKKSTCNTLANGAVTVTGSGGSSPYTYSQGGGAFGAVNTFSPLAAATYSFHIKDGQNCIKDTFITISDSLTVVGNIIVTNALCNNQSSGAITVTGAGGVSPYTFAFGAGVYSATNTFTGLAAGTYALHIKDVNGCLKDTSNILVSQPTAIIPVPAVLNVSCNGLNDASVTLNASGGTPIYTYAIGTGAYGANNTFTGLAAGSYTLHVKDANGCIKDTTVTITQPLPLAFTLGITNVLCNGASTGKVTVVASGGTPSYEYTFDAGTFGSSNLLTGFNAGAHIIHLRDAHACTKDTTINITQPPVLQIAYVAIAPSCFNTTDGSITISGSGGTATYQYALNAGAFGASGAFTNLNSGSFTIHLKDANSCTVDSTITLVQPPVIYVSAYPQKPFCSPLVNGSVLIVASGGTPGFMYAVSTGSYNYSPILGNLPAGTFIFHTKDSRGCIKDTTITLTDSVYVHANITETLPLCFGQANGQITVNAYGGDTAYQYALGTSAYSLANPIPNVAAGSYILHVKDVHGCILDTNITMSQPAVLLPTASITRPSCYGLNDGSITIGGTGGNPNYTFAMGTGTFSSTSTFGGLGIGTYLFHIKDATGCAHDTSVTMTQPTPLKIDSVKTVNVKCFGGTSGQATIYGSGATSPYTYAADANAFQASDLVTGLNVGAHAIHLKDNNGCTKDTSISLTQPSPVYFANTSITEPTCEGFKDGSITVNGTGGTPGYLYSPDNVTFSTSHTYAGLPEGSYHLYLSDTNNCLHDTTIALMGYPHIVISDPAITGVSCYGRKDGVIVLNVSGGVQPLTYIMKKPKDTSGTGEFDSLAKGTYNYHIVDSKGCIKDTSFSVTQPDSLTATTTVTPNDCVGEDNGGGAKAIVTGGTQPYSYAWSNGGNTQEITGDANGIYMVQVRDAHDCRDSAVADVLYDDCCKPFIPDAFTPNGDGLNDIFRVKWKGDIYNMEFSVYNRFGQRVFIGRNAADGWDGKFNGVPQDLGVYFYYIKFICGNKGDHEVSYKGDVTLIR